MDAAKWSQGFQDIGFVKPMEEMGSNTCTSRGPVLERKTKPAEQLNCPRCNSTNTKFCYYNNYSLTQPRYFCKSCRRYWTEGGSLRNVPVGGGSRKNKRSTTSYSSISSASASASAKVPDLNPTNFTHLMSSHQNPNNKNHKSQQDLNLGFPAAMQEAAHGFPQYLQLPKQEQITSTQLSALELLRTGMTSRGLNLFVPSDAAAAAAPTPDHHSTTQLYSTTPSGFTMKDYKPTLSFSIDGVNNENGGGRLFFPFGDHQMKPISSEMDDQNNQGQDNSAAAYWNNNHNGMLGGGGSW